MQAADRVSVGALAAGDVGVGLYLIGAQQTGSSWVHALAGVLALLLALPAAAAAVSGRLPRAADEGVLVNVGVLLFMTLEVVFLPGHVLQRVGLSVLLAAATAATIGLWLRAFRAARTPETLGRHS